jgi:dynein heavy chain
MGELFGDYNEFSGDWKDGLASSFMRLYAEDETDTYRWVVFDGPVDAKWIENMNTVLDDNMMLCLANSERIKLKKEMRMLFEVQDLAYASPATVSRCGMVYIKKETIGWKPYVKSWIKRQLGEWKEDR